MHKKANDSQYFFVTSARLENEAQNIRNRQASLLRRLNDLKATSHALPPPILATVLLYACADLRSYEDMQVYYPAIQVISRVCSKWRQIVCATPCLWTRVNIRFARGNNDWASINSLNMLQLHLKNSGELPLDIALDIPNCYSCDRTINYPSTAEEHPQYIPHTTIFRLIFIENSNKLGSLLLTRTSYIVKTWLELIESYTTSPSDPLAIDGFPNLTRLEFRSSNGGTVFSNEHEPKYHLFRDTPVPRLTSLSLANKDWAVRVPMTNLTSLTVEVFPIDKCLNFLLTCLNLTSFRQRHPSSPSSDHQPSADPRSEIISLPKLETLEWWFGFRISDIELMSRFRFPSLSSFRGEILSIFNLQVTESDKMLDEDYTKYWAPFLSSLHNLESFSIDCEYLQSDKMQVVMLALSNLNRLHSLHLHGHTAVLPETRATNFTDHLRPLTISPNTLTTPINLPHLRQLCLDDDYVSTLGDPNSTESVETLLALLESRWEDIRVPRLESLHLRGYPFGGYDADSPVWKKWTNEQRRRLERLEEEGLKLKMSKDLPFFVRD